MYADNPLDNSYESRLKKNLRQLRWQKIHLDPLLLLLLILLATFGLFILYSASSENGGMLKSQLLHYVEASIALVVVAQIKPKHLQTLTPWFYGVVILFLIAVLGFGHVSQGARRWFQLGPIQIQPSEFMKLAMPMMLAWAVSNAPQPLDLKHLSLCAIILLLPTLLTAKQPDLGTAILIFLGGFYVIVLAGIPKKVMGLLTLTAVVLAPIGWHFLHAYQKQRILTLFNPERDPLGAGYNIIQSKIAVGSGGFLGKGWLQGTQAHLAFLPTHTTDFIFAVNAEEFGLIGGIILLLLLIAISARAIFLALNAQNTFNRLLCASIALTFFSSSLINIAMVIGLVPVVGVPLPLVSYGGSSILTTLIGFGIIMSVSTHKKLWSS